MLGNAILSGYFIGATNAQNAKLQLANTRRVREPQSRVKTQVCVCIFSLGVLALGCGRPATVQDCEQIIARVTELELKQASITDPAVVEEQVAKSKTAFKDQAMSQCVGRRVTKEFMACIANAATAPQLLEECLN